MTERNDSHQGNARHTGTGRDNAAWQAARAWQARARRARPSASMSGPRLFFTWLMFGVLMLVGTVLGLFFLLVGWLMLPLVRHRMKKQAEAFRARHAQNIGGSDAPRHDATRSSRQQVLEGDYEVRDEPTRQARNRDGFH
ncbi:hypothetical protein R6258_18515 [Halomonas sp. HP20-15]|uniref:hypothetical protein n=1 Tax=Halomonas sp. HP20-15 TaxID=3085901 RepID=UPI0029812AFC|nr:hypothetical protein [Halomonas sp. HP20-15]MDW5378915.1 hypothetical protein [Halomonas sp. HP20-15]